MDLKEKIFRLSDEYEKHTLQLRHAIHCHPELSFQEKETSALVQRELARIGIPYQLSPVEPGVVATIDSGRPGKYLHISRPCQALVPLWAVHRDIHKVTYLRPIYTFI